MATHQSKAQKETVERVMHEFKHGKLKTSRGKKVKNPKQAIAIGLHEAGASKYESKEQNRQPGRLGVFNHPHAPTNPWNRHLAITQRWFSPERDTIWDIRRETGQ